MSKNTLNSMFDDVELARVQQFDPVSFAYIESLAARLKQPLYASNAVLKEKLHRSIDALKASFDAANKQADAALKNITVEFPEYENVAIRYFDQGQFKKINKLELKLKEAARAPQSMSLLSDLNSKIHKQVIEIKVTNKAPSFEQMLNRQELELAGQSVSPKKITEEPLELQSMKVFRESMKYFNVDKILERAINDEPENPGPHNPHMLAVKSLTQMRDISPQYCRRFGGYIETLLWLEKNAVKLNPTKTH